MRPALPIDGLLPEIIPALQKQSRLVLRAAPGAGKTTRVPAALLDAGIAAGREIVVLEPRRLAARAAAAFVARERRQSVGSEVGYRVRHDSAGGPGTRLWFVTEGVFGRRLVSDPFLEKVGIVVLDEFHERHLATDVALGIVRELQESVRPDLRLLVMSATLDTQRLVTFLGDCAVVTSEGRQHPITISYTGAATGHIAIRAARAVRELLESSTDDGDILVFLPGAAEIRRTAEALHEVGYRYATEIVILHGDLPIEAQQRAIQRGDRRKIVLSTNVAETSLTIEGVTTVVDSGLAKEARYDARRGLNVLRTVSISQAAATQRAGRAGRTRPGRCVRLGTQADFQQRRAFETPEVSRLDLSGTVLELRAWGSREISTFPWLDAPPAGSIAKAEAVLRQLGALDGDGAVTAIGHRMLKLPLEPRLARCLIEAESRDCLEPAILLAALAAERDILAQRRAFGGKAAERETESSDLLVRARLFCRAARSRFSRATCESLGLDPRSVHAVERARRQMLRILRVAESAPEIPSKIVPALKCLLAGFPDRVCRRRSAGSARALMVGGTGVRLGVDSVVREAELFLAIDLEGRESGAVEAEVRVASAIERSWLEEVFPKSVTEKHEILFDAGLQRVVGRCETRFFDLCLESRPAGPVDSLAAGEILASAARRNPEQALTIGSVLNQTFDRLVFLAEVMPDLGFPKQRKALVEELAGRAAHGRRSFAETRQVDLTPILRQILTPSQWQTLEREAPAVVRLPTGRLARISYETGRPPSVAVKIQELFGLRSTPRLAGGRVPLVIELLAPNARPVQITSDLENFWKHTYPEVRKILRGRYPKHPWPEDPFTAAPTARTKSR